MKHATLNHECLKKFWFAFLRITTGVYWLYFASQRWFNYSWVKPLIENAGKRNAIPIVRELLNEFVVPNWQLVVGIQTLIETFTGLILILGWFPKLGGTLGAALATLLTVVFAFSSDDFPLVFWFYFLTALLNATTVLDSYNQALSAKQLLRHLRTKR